jgi:hypothetical protein
MILINMTTGRSPWRAAVCSDECFASYLQDPDFLRTMLPLSASAAALARGTLVLNPTARTSIGELRAGLLAVDTFYMTEAELKRSNRHVREVVETYLELSLAAPPPVTSQTADREDQDLGKAPPTSQEQSPDHVIVNASPRRALPRPPVAAAASSPPSMLAAGGSTLGVPSLASSGGPVTPTTHAVVDAGVANAADSIEEFTLPQADAPLYKPRDFQAAAGSKTGPAVKKERNANLLRQAMQKLHLGH